MLIIREEINLKELKKFGFEYKEETKNSAECYEINTKRGAVLVFTYNREIFAQNLDVLWDLFQEGLVKKVVE